MLNWLRPFNIFCLLDNSGYHFEPPAFECLVAVGCKAKLELNAGNAFALLKVFSEAQQDWLFGHLGYDLKNETEELESGNFDGIGFKDTLFFVPEIVLQLSEESLIIHCYDSAEKIYADIQSSTCIIKESLAISHVIDNQFTKEAYLNTIQNLKQHILRGDCYEINFCQEFFSRAAKSVYPRRCYRFLPEVHRFLLPRADHAQALRKRGAAEGVAPFRAWLGVGAGLD